MNIVKMQEELKGVPDQALIGYVQNPGQVPSYLALAEIKRRETMRKEAAANQQQAPQQSVAEQMTTPQTPAPQGVASLPVQNVGNEQAYKAGGIVAFANQGAVEAPNQSYIDNLNEQRAILGLPPVTASDVAQWGTKRTDLPNNSPIGPDISPAKSAEATRRYMLRNQINNQLTKMDAQAANASAYPTGGGYVTPEADRAGGTNDPARQKATAEFLRKDALRQQKDPSNPVSPAAQAPGSASAKVSSKVKGPSGGVDSLLKAPELEDYNPKLLDTSVYDEQLKNKPTYEGIQALMAKRRADAGINDDMFKDQLAEVAKSKEDLAEAKRIAPWQALANAGFGMMQGKSQYALQNIGQGAQAGMQNYYESLKDIKAEQKALRKEDMDIQRADQARREARLQGDTAAFDKADEKYETILGKKQAREDANNALINDGRKINVTERNKLKEEIYKQQMEYKGKIDSATISANATTTAYGQQGKEFDKILAAVKQDPKYRNLPESEQMRAAKEIQGTVQMQKTEASTEVGMQGRYNDYVKNFMPTREQKRPLEYNQWAAQNGVRGTGAKGNTAGWGNLQVQ